MTHQFTEVITRILEEEFGDLSATIFQNSELINYINLKTRSASRGSKSRGSFGSLYAIYVLVEDYIAKKFNQEGDYSKYEGAKFTDLFTRQRQLPFGARLQNHALNQRMNEEFKKFFPACDYIPIIRVVETKRYWINKNLILLNVGNQTIDISTAIIRIIDAYIDSKRNAFESFIETCEQLKVIEENTPEDIKKFIVSLLEHNVDARIFEIVSFSILKTYYFDQTVYFGFSEETVSPENLKLYKTGRTNANDGGIDFVMKPLGRFFQVTETTDVRKYFLDIDKLEKFPVSFVVKSKESAEALKDKIRLGAKIQYSIDAIVEKYMSCVEEIINIQRLEQCLDEAFEKGNVNSILSEIIQQSKVEFNYDEE